MPNKAKKRIISVGFIKTDEQFDEEDDTIYVNICGGKYPPVLKENPSFADAGSCKKFKYYEAEGFKKKISFGIYTHNIESRLPLDDFIDSLKNLNNAEIDYSRALREGSYAFGLIGQQTEKLQFLEGDARIPRLKKF